MKTPIVVDANIILRFLCADRPELTDRCTRLFKRVEAGAETIILPDLVLADVIWTLEKFYRQNKVKIREVLTPILNMKGLRFSSKESALLALNLYAELNTDWTEAWVAAWMSARGIRRIYSYDREIKAVRLVSQLEP